MLGMPLGDDSKLWTVQLDNAEADLNLQVPHARHFHAEASATKHKLFIEANGVQLEPDKVVTNAEFCVGQKVTFNVEFDPTLSFVDHVSHWHLPDKYVNEEYDEFHLFNPQPTNYRVDDELLTELPTSCWFISGSGGSVSIGTSLRFSNGQLCSIAALGKIELHRPSFFDFQPIANEFYWAPPILSANMKWRVKIASKFDGHLGTNGWSMNGDACLVGGTGATNVTQASPVVDSDAFPDWFGVFHE
jgi:hypothetical protein